jgi:hypothetical protein
LKLSVRTANIGGSSSWGKFCKAKFEQSPEWQSNYADLLALGKENTVAFCLAQEIVKDGYLTLDKLLRNHYKGSQFCFDSEFVPFVNSKHVEVDGLAIFCTYPSSIQECFSLNPKKSLYRVFELLPAVEKQKGIGGEDLESEGEDQEVECPLCHTHLSREEIVEHIARFHCIIIVPQHISTSLQQTLLEHKEFSDLPALLTGSSFTPAQLNLLIDLISTIKPNHFLKCPFVHAPRQKDTYTYEASLAKHIHREHLREILPPPLSPSVAAAWECRLKDSGLSFVLVNCHLTRCIHVFLFALSHWIFDIPNFSDKHTLMGATWMLLKKTIYLFAIIAPAALDLLRYSTHCA